MVYFSTALIVSGILCITEVWSQVSDAERQGGTPWATAEEEATDEVNDPALFKAIVDSMRDWSKRHRNKTRRRRGAPSVCYDGVGCFDDTGYLDMAPSSPEIVQTRFLLYSARSPRSESPIMDLPFVNISTLDSWNVNVSLPTKVIVHGFGSSCSNVWVYEMRSALMSVEDCNVICVDWENGAGFPNYVRAAANTRLVGRQLSLLLETMSGRGLNLSNTHVIGFSLGAHAAAFAGSRLSKIYRITGLDPAGPLFESQDPANRLDSTDAEFVDVIHSNGETLILGGLGSSQPMGHVDFYPNGGRMQKGCTNLFVGAFTDIIWSGAALEARSLCNHRRAYKFFTDSVSPRCGFPAMACHSYEAFLAGQCFPCPQGKKCPNMGYYADVTKARGTLYLVTRDEEPFCAHQYLVRVESGPSLSPASSYGKIQITLVSDSQINETFTLTMKDDEELIAGSALSKIIVPHPALEQFSSLALLYTAYSGWISSGLAQWSVTSVYLMDSLSNKWTVCDKEIVLESGVEAIFPLVKGECNTTEIILLDSNSTLSRRNSSYYPTEVVYIGEEILEEKDKRSANGSGDPVDLSPPKVGASQSWVYRSGQERSINANRSEIVDLSPPKIGATQSWLYWGGQERSITVQLLPKRLARLVEGALSSDRVPRRLLSWITAPHSAPTASHYIPVSKAKKPSRRDREHRNNTSEKMHP